MRKQHGEKGWGADEVRGGFLPRSRGPWTLLVGPNASGVHLLPAQLGCCHKDALSQPDWLFLCSVFLSFPHSHQGSFPSFRNRQSRPKRTVLLSKTEMPHDVELAHKFFD